MSLTKTVCQRAAIGVPIGIAIGYSITIGVSLSLGTDTYYAVNHALIQSMGGQLSAVIFQYLMCALVGAVFSGGSAIWEAEHWGLARQTIVHFALVTLTMMPVAWFSGWVGHTLTGFLIYLGVFAGIYLIHWVVLSMYWRNKVSKINQHLG